MSIWGWIKGLFSGAGSAISGVGAIAAAVEEVAKTAGKITDEVHDHNQRTAGQDHIVAADNGASAKVNEDVAKAAVDTTDRVVADSLRDGKF